MVQLVSLSDALKMLSFAADAEPESKHIETDNEYVGVDSLRHAAHSVRDLRGQTA